MNLTREQVRELTDDLREVLEKHFVGKHNLKITGIKGTYSQNTFEPKISMISANIEDQRAEFDKKALWFGLEGKYGAQFTYEGDVYRIIGINERAKKMPIKTIRLKDGINFKFSAELVRRNIL